MVGNRGVGTPPRGVRSRSPMAAGRLMLTWAVLLVGAAAAAAAPAVPRSTAIAAGIAAANGAVAAGDGGAVSDMRFRRRPQEQPFDDISWSNLRRFVCGSAENEKCMNDDRFNQLHPDFLRKLSARFNQFVPLDTPAEDNNLIAMSSDSVPEIYSNDVNIWNSLNLSGRREGPFYVDEPDYVLTQESRAQPSRMSDYISDPFIPQRGRRGGKFAKRSNGPVRMPIDYFYGSHQMQPQHNMQTMSMATHHDGNDQASCQCQQSSHHPRYYDDHIDDEANLSRFHRHYLTPDNLAAADNDIAVDEESNRNPVHKGTEHRSSESIPGHHNLSPAQGTADTQPATSDVRHMRAPQQQHGANRDTFYLARGSPNHHRSQ